MEWFPRSDFVLKYQVQEVSYQMIQLPQGQAFQPLRKGKGKGERRPAELKWSQLCSKAK